MGLRDTQKNADASNVTSRGQYFNFTGKHQAVVRKVKAFESRKKGNQMVAIEWELEASDNPQAQEVVGQVFTWLGDLDLKWQKDVYPNRDRLDQFVEAILGGDGVTQEQKDELYDIIDNDEECLDGQKVVIKTSMTKTDNGTDFTTYEFYAAE